MSPTATHRRVVLARAVASRYLADASTPEYRLTIFIPGGDNRNIPGLLSGFRDGRRKVGGLTAPSDLGLREGLDSVTMWSADDGVLRKLAAWFEFRGFDTSGVH
jgi:hypothetical protein